jgi:two-component system, OmpR family, phosphate regulon sensor histidine kinase PhoR
MKLPRLTIAARFAITSVLLLIGAGLGFTALRSPEQRLEALIATGAAVGGAVATFAVAVRLVRRPIREVTRAALSMAAGDLYDRARVRSDDEITTLAEALNRLAGDLSGTIATLREERDLLAGILDGMVEGVLVVDAHDRIVLANRALQGLTMAFEDAKGKLVLEVIRNAALKEALDASQESDEPVVREIELGRLMPRKLLLRVSRLPGRSSEGKRATTTGRSRAGKAGAALASGSAPGRDGERHLAAPYPAERGTIAVFHDVTDLRRLETIRTDFVANVSHELRTPVTAISTATETLLGGALDHPEEAAEFMDVIDRHAKRLRQLVDDLLDLAKLEAKSFRLVLADLEVSPIISHVAALMADPARRRNVTILIEPPGPRREPLRARIDRRALEQVLLNLLDNAIKYAGEGAQVTVRARPLPDLVELSVTDDGAGISPAHLGRVFERFYRVDTGRSRELGGTGLGLSIVKHLVELMGGKIEVASELGKGARFTICLNPATSASSDRPPG